MTIRIVKAMNNLIVIKLLEFDTCNPIWHLAVQRSVETLEQSVK